MRIFLPLSSLLIILKTTTKSCGDLCFKTPLTNNK
uniref:Uncharacterized protein n=1 Tax=Lotus japonicus TaxID=34305 RepID=I3TAH5_LOTJA|nr:unknown [Lotus japonicus]